MDDKTLVERLRAWEPFVSDGYEVPDAGKAIREAADTIEAQATRIEALEAALVSERQENLWNAYATGHVKDGRWSHCYMSDGEWLAVECGLDPKLAYYDDAAIKEAIPLAARKALEGTGND